MASASSFKSWLPSQACLAQNGTLPQEESMLPTYCVRPAPHLESTMIKDALFVRLEAKAGKEKEVIKFLQASLGLAQQEGTTPMWFALQLGPSTLGIFDAFADEAAREAHLNGPCTRVLGAKAPKLLAQVPLIERI